MQHPTFTTSDIIAIFSLFIGVLSIAVAIYYARKSHRYQKQVAESQGVFKKGDIKLSIFNLNKDFNGGFLDYLFIAGPLKKDTISYLPFPLQITNEGSKSVTDIEVTTRIHRSLRVVNSNYLGMKLPSTGKNIKYGNIDSGSHQIISIFIDTINPKREINFVDGFLFKEALPIYMEVKAETKDQHRVTVPVYFITSSQMTINLHMKDEEPIIRSLKVVLIDTTESTLEHQLNIYNMAAKKSFKKPSFFKWIFGPKIKIEKFTLLEFDKDSYLNSDSDFSEIDLAKVNATIGFFNIDGTINSHYQWNE